MTLSFGSLFSGVGGFDLGLEQVGFTPRWQVEIDKHCRSLLASKWPNVTQYEDVKYVGRKLQPVDLVCGGFPCQDLSVAGRRAGLAGERSGLWYEFHRIITETLPAWVLIENVPGLLSSDRGRDFAIVLGGLAGAIPKVPQDGWGNSGVIYGEPYSAAWRVFDSQYFGVPQRRRRVYIVASLGDSTRAAQVLFEQESLRGNIAPSEETRQVSPPLTATGVGAGRTGNERNELDFAIPVMGSGRDQSGTLQANYGTKWGLGDQEAFRGEHHVIEQKAFTIQTNDGGAHRRKDRPEGGMYISEADKALTIGSSDLTAVAFGHSGGETVKLNEKTNALNAQSGSESTHMVQGVVEPVLGVRRLTPLEAERLQGFPDGWTEGFADSIRYKMLGNAVTVNVIRWLGRRILLVGQAYS